MVMPVGIRQCVDESCASRSLTRMRGSRSVTPVQMTQLSKATPSAGTGVRQPADQRREASGPGSDVRVSAVEEGNEVVCRVEDTGTIPGDALTKVFDPFFTTKGPGEGTGMGGCHRDDHRRRARRIHFCRQSATKAARGTCVTCASCALVI